MKQLIIAGVAVMATAVSVAAQGQISFSTAKDLKPRIQVDGVNATSADNIFVQILIAGGTGLTSDKAGFDPATAFKLTLGGGNAGLFTQGVTTVGNKAGGSIVDVTVQAWDADSGADYASATTKSAQTFSVTLGNPLSSPPGTPASIAVAGAFTGLNLTTSVVPEPSTYALAALGLGGLLFLRRK